MGILYVLGLLFAGGVIGLLAVWLYIVLTWRPW